MRMRNRLNLGDASFWRKNYIAPMLNITQLLRKYVTNSTAWTRERYNLYPLIEENNNQYFNRLVPKSKKWLVARAGTITNGLCKLGLVYRDTREITPVCKDWQDNKLYADDLEQNLALNADNIVCLRQFLKMRVYKSSNHFIRPVLFLIKLLSRYNYIPQKQLYMIFESLNPDLQSEQDLNDIIDDYKNVNSRASFIKYYQSHFNKNLQGRSNLINSILLQIRTKSFQQLSDGFGKIFYNNKSKHAIFDYFRFVKALVQYHYINQHSVNNRSLQLTKLAKELIKLSRKADIKKAFGYQRINGKSHRGMPFKLSGKFKLSKFVYKYQHSELLYGNLNSIYQRFFASKNYDLINKYGNLNFSLLMMTSIFTNNHGEISLANGQRFLWEILLNNTSLKMADYGNQNKYESGNSDSFCNDDESLLNILNISNDALIPILTKVINKITNKNWHHLSLSKELSILQNFSNQQRDSKLKNKIKQSFSVNKLIKINHLYMKRCRTNSKNQRAKIDKIIQTLVGIDTPVTTIFEYIIGIEWYYLSSGKINLWQGYHLSMNGEMLPLNQAPGGEGDLEFYYQKPRCIVQLEVTLMNKDTQKKGEIEPVIRHTANLATTHPHIPVITFFISDEVAENTKRFFDMASVLELRNSNCPNVSRLSTGENIEILNLSKLTKLLEMNRQNPAKYNDKYLLKWAMKKFHEHQLMIKTI